MKNNKDIHYSFKVKRILWCTIAGLALMKAIEGPNHIITRKKHKKNNNKIIYLYK